MTEISIADICALACAEAFRSDGEILVSPMGPVPRRGARLAQATFAPEILLTDGVSQLQRWDGTVEGWMPFASVFDTLWSGKRHVMMGAAQLDRYGNQNISCIGDPQQPKAMLIGARGAPGNTICHRTSYYVAKHSRRVFVERVDLVCGVGTDRARALGSGGRFHRPGWVISNLGVFDFASGDGGMRVRSLHPGVSVEQVRDQTGFEVHVPDAVAVTRLPTANEQEWLARLDAR